MYKKFYSLLLASLLLISMFTVSASANSAQTWWKGTDSTGVIITEGDCPLVVKNEVLTFNIDSFPDTYYHSQEELNKYGASVTAQYTFYNPSVLEVTAKLLFPFGERPMYYYEYFDEEKGHYISGDDTQKYEIILNGKPVDKTVRHTLNDGSFNVQKELSKIRDGFSQDSFYYPEMPVKKYTFIISEIDEEYDAANAGFDLGEFDGRTKYYFAEQSGRHRQSDGDIRVSAWANNGETLTLYVIGDISRALPVWTMYKNGGVEDKDTIGGSVTLIDEEQLTFSEFVFTCYDSNSEISDTDWYNAVIENLNMNEDDSGCIPGADNILDVADSLLRWYEYEIKVAANSEAINTVNAPVYPVIDANYSPAVYDYTYLLSPAKTWADFGTLNIKINTPYFLVQSGNFAFSETASGYELQLEGLPEEELSFRLSLSEAPQKTIKTITDYLPVEIIIMLTVFAAIVLIIISVILLIKKLRKKR